MKSEIEIHNEYAVKGLIRYWNNSHENLNTYLHAAVMYSIPSVSEELFWLDHINAIKVLAAKAEL